LDVTLDDLESQMLGLREALKSGDAATLDRATEQFKASLLAARRSLLTGSTLRTAALAPHQERLRLATVELRTQREALARAAASVDRAALVLMPGTEAAYDAQGLGTRPQPHGSVIA
jgi:hypothetical protein